MDRNKMNQIIRVKDELIKRFRQSKEVDGSITIQMKCDGRELVIVPEYHMRDEHVLENAYGFAVYTYLENGKAAIPYMCSTDIMAVARSVVNYDGIRLDKLNDDVTFNYYIMMMPDKEEIDPEEWDYERYIRYFL